MAIPRFYVGPDRLVEGTVRLSAGEALHARASRRLRAGDEVCVFDGQGNEGFGRLATAGTRGMEVCIGSLRHRQQDAWPRLTLAVAFPKGPRQDWMIEKCTELGVEAVWPMRCERSIAEPSAARIDKLNRTIVEASKQSQRAWLLQILPPRTFQQVLALRGNFGIGLLGDASGDATALETAPHHDRVLILIGPEGGFSDAELSVAGEHDFPSASLGGGVLRTETAAITVAARLLKRT